MIILVDQDETIAKFNDRFQELWKQLYPKEVLIPLEEYASSRIAEHYPPELQEKVKAVYTSPGFILGLRPVEGSIEAIHEMIRAGHDVRICTAPLGAYQNCLTEKYQWIEKYLGDEFTRRVILTKDKTLIRGDVLIDDDYKIQGILTPVWKHVIFDRPYNRNVPGPRLRSWGEWREVVHE